MLFELILKIKGLTTNLKEIEIIISLLINQIKLNPTN